MRTWILQTKKGQKRPWIRSKRERKERNMIRREGITKRAKKKKIMWKSVFFKGSDY